MEWENKRYKLVKLKRSIEPKLTQEASETAPMVLLQSNKYPCSWFLSGSPIILLFQTYTLPKCELCCKNNQAKIG